MTAHCLGPATPGATCPWTHDGPDADKAAERHTKATGHGTSTSLVGRTP